MTKEEFLAFYPQFDSSFPSLVLDAYVVQANARFDQFEEDAEEARRLFVAHKLTMYARTFPAPEDESEDKSGDKSGDEAEEEATGDSESTGTATRSYSYSRLASSGDGTRITGKRVENVQITYSSGSSSASYSSAAFADLAETVFGQQLLSLLKLYSWPRYVP